MPDLFDPEIVRQFKETEANFRPGDIDRWNGTSWDFVTIGMLADVPPEDHAIAMSLGRKALDAVASAERGFFGVFSRQDALDLIASRNLPLEPAPETRGDTYNGVPILYAKEDPHRVERRQQRAALILRKLEQDPSWRPSKLEMDVINKRAGIRQR